MKKLLLICMLPLAASQEMPKPKALRSKDIFDKIKELHNNTSGVEKVFKSISFIEYIMIDNMKKLHTMRDSIRETKTLHFGDIEDAKKWLAEIEMVSLYFKGCQDEATANLDSVTLWRKYFKDIAAELWDGPEKKDQLL